MPTRCRSDCLALPILALPEPGAEAGLAGGVAQLPAYFGTRVPRMATDVPAIFWCDERTRRDVLTMLTQPMRPSPRRA